MRGPNETRIHFPPIPALCATAQCLRQDMDCSHDIKDLPAGGGGKVLVEVPSSSRDAVVKKLMKAPPTIPVVSAKPTDAASCALNVHICSITYRFIVTYLPMICFLVTWFMVPRCQAKHSLQDSLAKRLESK